MRALPHTPFPRFLAPHAWVDENQKGGAPRLAICRYFELIWTTTDREVQEDLRFWVLGGRRGRERRITRLEAFGEGRDGAGGSGRGDCRSRSGESQDSRAAVTAHFPAFLLSFPPPLLLHLTKFLPWQDLMPMFSKPALPRSLFFQQLEGTSQSPSQQENTNRLWVLWLQHLFTSPKDSKQVSELNKHEIFPVFLVLFSLLFHFFKICTASIPALPAIWGHRPEPLTAGKYFDFNTYLPVPETQIRYLSSTNRKYFQSFGYFSPCFSTCGGSAKHMQSRLTITALGTPVPAVGSTTTFTPAGKRRKILGWLSWKQGPACSGSCTQQWSSWEMCECEFSKA